MCIREDMENTTNLMSYMQILSDNDMVYKAE